MAIYDAFISYSHAKDKAIASALQSAVQKLGKPWYRRRMLRVFRDDTSLSASPNLWSSIQKALEESRFLILLASEQAAASAWVAKEVQYWLDHKSPDTLLIAVTDGSLEWDPTAGDFRWSDTTCLPSVLVGRFPHEPKWVDVSAYRNGHSKQDAKFTELAADLAAAVSGQPKEDLLSQEVRQQRRALTLAWSAVGSLLVLGALAGWQWFEAAAQRQEATTQRDVAQVRERQAVIERDRALATESRFLAELSNEKIRNGDVDVAALLSLEALPDGNSHRPYVAEAERSLYSALHSRRLLSQLQDHSAPLKNPVFSHNGRYIAAPASDGQVAIWKSESGERILSVAHDLEVEDVRFSPNDTQLITLTRHDLNIREAGSGRLLSHIAADYALFPGGRIIANNGQLVIAGTRSGAIVVVSLATGRAVATIKAHKDGVTAVSMSGDGRRFASASQDGTVAVWDIAAVEAGSARPIFRLSKKADVGFLKAALNADGSRLLTLTGSIADWRRSDVNTAQLWDRNGKMIAELKGHEFRIEDAAFSPDGHTIGTVASDGTARLWNAANGQPSVVLKESGTRIAFSADSTRLLVIDIGEVRVWHVASGRRIARIKLTKRDSYIAGASFDPTGRRVVVAAGSRASVWDVSARSPVTLPADFDPADRDSSEVALIAPGGRSILYSRSYAYKNDPNLPTELWDAGAGTLLTKLPVENGFSFNEIFSPNGSLVASGCDKCEKAPLVLINAADGKVSTTLVDDPARPLAFSPDGNLLLVGQGKLASVYDIPTRRKLATLIGHARPLLNGSFRNDNAQILTTAEDNTARVWETNSGRLLQTIQSDNKPITFATFGPTHAEILTVVDRLAYIRDSATGELRVTLEGHSSQIETARFNSDGSRIVTASTDKTAIIWDSRTGKKLAVLRGHQKELTDAEFSPDGLRILTHSADNTTRLWDAGTGNNIAVLASYQIGGNMIARFSTNGDHVLIASEDHTLITLPVLPTTEALIAFAKQTAPVCLTLGERRQLGVNPEPPFWCIELSKWPYQSTEWQEWLRLKKANANPPLPNMP